MSSLNYFLKLQIPHICNHLLKPIIFSQTARKVGLFRAVYTVPKKIESEIPIYKKREDDYKISKKATLRTLEELLNIKTFEAHGILLNNPYFRQVSKNTLRRNYICYLQKRVTHETVLKYPQILAVADGEAKVKELEQSLFEMNDVILLVLLPHSALFKFLRSEPTTHAEQSKIALMSSLLQISKQKACQYIAEKPFLLSLSYDKMQRNIKTLLEYGITTEDICNDLWVLRYSEELIRTRLGIAKEHNIETMKTWMVRAQQGAFQTHIQRRSDNKSILGDNSLVEYLSNRLECSESIANYMILKQPALKSKSLKKLKELIDFLYAEGFQSHQICRVPKILVHSVETTRRRLKQLQEKGIKLDGLSLLTKSQNQFTQYYEALLKTKNKSKSQT